MKNSVKLMLYLLLSAALVFFLWARAECPRLTAQGALHRIESANLAPKSQLISTHFLDIVNSNGTNYRRHIAAGITDTHLHMSEVWKGAFLWHHTGRLYIPLTSFPLEDALTGIAPDQWPFDYTFFCYTTLPAQSWKARLEMGSFSCTQEGECDASGFTLFRFQTLSPATRYQELEPWIADNLSARVYDMVGGGYDKSMKTHDIRLELTLFDQSGAEIAQAIRTYPAE